MPPLTRSHGANIRKQDMHRKPKRKESSNTDEEDSVSQPSSNTRRNTTSHRREILNDNPSSAFSNSVSRHNSFSLAARRKRPFIKKTPSPQPLNSPENDISNTASAAAASCRYDNSLGLLTKKFVDLLKEAKDGDLNLNTAATALKVQKRRIYDITNVLEGIGLIEKNSKNHVRWKGTNPHSPAPGNCQDYKKRIDELKAANAGLRSEHRELERKELELDAKVKSIFENEESARLAFLHQSDIEAIASLSDDILIAVSALYGAALRIPEPIENGQPNTPRYQIQIDNQPINVFKLRDNDLDYFHHYPQHSYAGYNDHHQNQQRNYSHRPSPPLNSHDRNTLPHLTAVVLPLPNPPQQTPPDERAGFEMMDRVENDNQRHRCRYQQNHYFSHVNRDDENDEDRPNPPSNGNSRNYGLWNH